MFSEYKRERGGESIAGEKERRGGFGRLASEIVLV
jgi:hypothetical protein